jgi:hypothetical protein
MKRQLLSSIVLMCAACLSGPALADTQCTDNYTLEGNFFKGRSFQSWGSYPGVSSNEAYTRAYANVAQQGFRIQQADREAGIIAAEQNVIGSGKVVPLNVIIEQEGSGARVSVSFTTTGGLAVGEESVKDGFCQILRAVSR